MAPKESGEAGAGETLRVLIAEPIAPVGVDLLRGSFEVDERTLSREELLEAIAGYDAIIIRSATKVDAELIRRAPKLKVVGRAGIGLDNVDVETATRHGIVVVNAPQSNILSAAEHAIALLMALARNIPRADASLRADKWERSKLEGVELYGKTLSVIGMGRIGTLVAQRMVAFDMKVLAFDPYVSPQRASQLGVEAVATLEEALSRADFVTVHLPKTADTKGLIGARELALMKPTARLVNAARGGIVDEDALAEAVKTGAIAGAALDVYSKEPPGHLSLFDLQNVVVTPHLGASTEEAQEKAGVTIAEQVLIALRGDLAPYAVNVDVGREVSDVVRPFVPLAEKLGKIFMLLSGGRVGQVNLSCAGQIAEHDTRVLMLAALKGAFSAIVHEPVTFVNAPLMAADHGISYSETKSSTAHDYVNVLAVEGRDSLTVAGTLVGPRDEERLVRVWDFQVEMPPGRYMCFIRYEDRPGVIGAVGTILGRTGVNIADMRVGRHERGGEALMCLTVDQPMENGVLDELSAVSGAKSAHFLVLD